MHQEQYLNRRNARPSGIEIPMDLGIKAPGTNLSDRVRAFFGRTGIWWGTWRSPQVKGSYDAVLIIREIKSKGPSDELAEITYLTPDYPNWYITAERWETEAAFVMRDDGRFVLRVPYAPAATTMDFWFDRPVGLRPSLAPELKGITYGRFMRRDIVLRPL